MGQGYREGKAASIARLSVLGGRNKAKFPVADFADGKRHVSLIEVSIFPEPGLFDFPVGGFQGKAVGFEASIFLRQFFRLVERVVVQSSRLLGAFCPARGRGLVWGNIQAIAAYNLAQGVAARCFDHVLKLVLAYGGLGLLRP